VTGNSRKNKATISLHTEFEAVNLFKFCTDIGCPLLESLLLQNTNIQLPMPRHANTSPCLEYAAAFHTLFSSKIGARYFYTFCFGVILKMLPALP
jgi:hypothetical protein